VVVWVSPWQPHKISDKAIMNAAQTLPMFFSVELMSIRPPVKGQSPLTMSFQRERLVQI